MEENEEKIINPLGTNELLNLYWPDRTHPSERSDKEDESIQDWLASYYEEWDVNDDEESNATLSMLYYEVEKQPWTDSCSTLPCSCWEPPLPCVSYTLPIGTSKDYEFASGGVRKGTVAWTYAIPFSHGETIFPGNYYLYDEDLRFDPLPSQVWEMGSPPTLGSVVYRPSTMYIKFNGINLKRGTKINKAILKFKVTSAINDIEAEITTNCVFGNNEGTIDDPWGDPHNISQHVQTVWNKNFERYVEWNLNPGVPTYFVSGQELESPDVSCLIKELFDNNLAVDTIQDIVFYIRPVEGDALFATGAFDNLVKFIYWDDTEYKVTGGGVICNGVAILNAPDVQISRPISDQNAGNWVVAPLYEKIDEVIPDDNDYISSANNPSNSTCIMKLSGIIPPQTTGGHHLKFRVKQTDISTPMSIKVDLLQGTSTVIATWTETSLSRTEWQEFTYVLTSVQSGAITDYSNLHIRFIANVI